MSKLILIQDPSDPEIMIYSCDREGMYNATKAYSQYCELYPSDDMPKWMSSLSVEDMLKSVQRVFSTTETFRRIYYTMDDRSGIYARPGLFRAFLNWLDTEYGARVCKIIDRRDKAIADAAAQKDQERLGREARHAAIDARLAVWEADRPAREARDAAQREEIAALMIYRPARREVRVAHVNAVPARDDSRDSLRSRRAARQAYISVQSDPYTYDSDEY